MFDDNGSYLLGLIEFFLFFAWFMCLFWVLSDIFRSKDLSGAVKTVWVVVVIILPWLGILVYLIVRGGGMHERAIEQQQAIQKAQNEYIQKVAGTGNATEQISSAKALLDSGAISQAEFDQLKTKALAS